MHTLVDSQKTHHRFRNGSRFLRLGISAGSFVFMAMVLMPMISFAQKGEDGPVGIFQSGREYDEFMGSVKQAAYGEGGNVELRAMIPMLNDMVLGQEFGTTAKQYGSTNNSEFDLLSDSNVREEIGMVDEQFDELQKMNAQIQRRAAEDIRRLDFSDREGLVARLKEIRERTNQELESLFVPEQLERLQQLRNRSQLRQRSLVDLLTTNPVKDRLEITDDQANKLRETEAELEREIQEKLAQMREDARKRLLENLDRSQQDQVNKILGDPFQFQEPARKPRGKPARKGKAK